MNILKEKALYGCFFFLKDNKANRIICYSEWCNTYENTLNYILKSDNVNYSTFDLTIGKLMNALSNITQIRVLGEQEYYCYVACEGVLGKSRLIETDQYIFKYCIFYTVRKCIYGNCRYINNRWDLLVRGVNL